MRQPIQVLLLLCVLASSVILFPASQAHAANTASAIIVRQLTVEDGLSQSSVHEVFQDSFGFIWLATEKGVNRYDGYEFSQFGKNAVASFEQNISSISEDQFRQIWIGSNDGISVYDPQTNQFSERNNGLASKNISAMIKHSDGTMWVATYDGLHHYSYQDKRFTVHKIPPQVLANANEITTLAETPDGLLIIGTQNQGVLLYEPNKNRFSILYYEPNPANEDVNEIRALFFDDREQLWIGTNQGLIKYDFYHKKSLGNVLNSLNIDGMRRQRIRSITEDDDGYIWVAIYGNGILSLNPRSSSDSSSTNESDNASGNDFKFYGYQPAIHHGLSTNAIRKLFFDNTGLLWIGSESYGVSIFNPTSRAFGHMSQNPGDPNSLSDNMIWSIEPDHQGNLWVGTEQGLNRISDKTQEVTRFVASNPKNTTTPLTSYRIHDIENDPHSNTLWVATNKGLNHFDPINGVIAQWQHHDDDPHSLASDFIYDIELDNQRQLWIASATGLNRLDLQNNKLHHYAHSPDDHHSLSPNTSVTKLLTDSSGTLWVGTNNGLNRYNPVSDNFDRFLTRQKSDQLSAYHSETNTITAMAEVKRGQIWVGYSRSGITTLNFTSDTGVNKLNPTTSHIGISNGLPTNTIFGIIPDHVGSAWISTMSGLVQYRLNGAPPRIFTAKEGLLGSEFNGGAYNVGNDGALYFGSTNGLTIVNPAQITVAKKSKHLLWTKAAINRHDGNYTLPLIEQNSLTLEHGAYAVTLHHTNLNYATPKQTRYAYQFNQLNDNWIDIGNDQHVTLHHLTTGQFTFSLRSKSDINADWGEPRQLTIIVNSPWWRTFYAYIAYLISAAVLAYTIHISRKQRRNDRRLMHHQNRLFAEAFKNTSEGVMIMHRSRTIVAVNAAFTTITGYSEKEVKNAGTNIINSIKHSNDFYEHIWATLDEEQQWHGEIWQSNKQGKDIAVEMTISSVTNEEQQVSHFVGVFSDITERLKAEEELRKLAKYDALTDLPNRTLLQDRLDHAIVHARREEQQLGLFFLDLDRFKHVNDSLGHDVGDLLLINVAERISKVLKDDDTFARLGGDEFVIIVEDYADLNQLTHVASQIIAELAKPFSLTGYEVSTSTSIGITVFPNDGQTSQHLLKNADTAMYHVKAQGRNNFQFYTQSMNVKAFERLSIENELRRAIESQQFVLHYQPRVNSTDGQVASIEALIRWQHPEKGLIAPGYFIDIAEDSGLIVPMSEWVIKQACNQLKTWRNAGFTEISLSVNLSPRLFSHYDLVEFIDQTLQLYQLPPAKLELEITESMLMNDVEATIADLHKLNELGCHISVDDFGTGYSSLSYLHRFPVHTLKIDRSFVSAIHQHPKGKALVDIIINLAQNLELELVAEGVETFDQFEFLQLSAPMQIQGYYFSKPVDAQVVMPLLIKGFNVHKQVAVT